MPSLSKNDRQLNQERIDKMSRGMLGFFVHKTRIVALIILGIVIWGVFSLFSLPREANPEVKIPIIVVSTLWPGASPTEVEDLITDKIEAQVESVERVKEVTSSSSFSSSQVSIEFEAEADIKDSLRKVRDAVDLVTDLPGEAEDAEVFEINFDNFPIATYSLVSDLPEQELKRVAERIQDELESISGVSEARLLGARGREFQVRLDPGSINRHSVGIIDVTGAIRAANITLPLGDIDLEDKTYALRANGKLTSIEELERIVIKATPEGTVLLGDVADITDGFEERTTASRIARDGGTQRPALSLQVFKTTGGNIIDIVDTATKRISELKTSGEVPASIDVVLTNDNSSFIRNDLRTLGRSGVQTFILIFIALTIALATRMALIAALAVPLIFLSSFGIISAQGSTLNSLTLFSLVLSLGLLVDTIIVLIEGIYDGLKQGYQPREAALLSLRVFRAPIISGVLTTIAAFVPMLLVSGIVGEFLKTLPITISAVLGSALLITLVIMPGVAALFLAWTLKRSPIKSTLFQRTVMKWLETDYHARIRDVLVRKVYRKFLIIGLIVMLMGSISLLVFGVIKTELFPRFDADFFFVDIELASGTVLSVTERAAYSVEEEVNKLPFVVNYVTNIGTGSNAAMGEATARGSTNIASIIVNLEKAEDRTLKSYEIADMLRERIARIDNARIEVVDLQGGPPTSAPIEVRVSGPDFSVIDSIVAEVTARISETEGTRDVRSDNVSLPPEFTFSYDHEKLGRYGLSAAQVSQMLRAAINGITATEMSMEREDVDVVVSYAFSNTVSADELKNVDIQTPTGETVKLASIADFSLESSREVIKHKDRERVTTVSAKIDQTRSLREIESELREKYAKIDLPQGYRIDETGEFESENQAFTDLYKSMIIAVLLIFFIMVVQFDSFKQPFAILFTLPLAFIGVILGTLMFGIPFSFAAFLGMVALVGIVVNDAIVLIDRINDNLKNRNMEFAHAIAEAGETRLQPIILTTVTTVLGVIPLYFADEFWRGLVIALAAGLIFATILTLYLVPVLYYIFERKRWQHKRRS